MSKQSNNTVNKNKKENKKVVEVVEVDEVEDDESEEELEVEVEVEDEKLDNNGKSKKVEYTSDSTKESFTEMETVINNIEKELKHLKLVYKTALKQYQKESKKTKKRRDNNPDAPKRETGFIKAKFIPDKFKKFYEEKLKNDKEFTVQFSKFDINLEQPQTDITKIIYHYIRTNDLYEKKEDGTSNKRAIKPDNSLTELLGIERGESIGFNNFQTYIKRLYNSNVVDVDNSNDESELEETKVKSTKKVATKTN